MLQYVSCSKCHQQLPATTDFFRPRHDRPRGWESRCRECQREQDRIRRRNKPSSGPRAIARALANKGLARCTRCHEIKPLTEDSFFPNAKKITGFCSWCKACNREHAKIRQRKRRKDPVGRRRILAEKKRHSRSEKGRETKRKQSLIDNNKRRQKTMSLPYNWTDELWASCQEMWDNKCAYCGKGGKLTQDHFIPLSSPRCTGTVPENMVPACARCNSSKGATLPSTWIKDKHVYLSIVSKLASIK
jgi:5-methylcytosine-specific restriction endonuclease McrA